MISRKLTLGLQWSLLSSQPPVLPQGCIQPRILAPVDPRPEGAPFSLLSDAADSPMEDSVAFHVSPVAGLKPRMLMGLLDSLFSVSSLASDF